MNRRKGKLVDLKDTGKNKKRLIFHAPTRGLMGYTSRFLTLTKGSGVINRIFRSYGDYTGEMEGRRNGALISNETGKAVAFAIFNLQARGELLTVIVIDIVGGSMGVAFIGSFNSKSQIVSATFAFSKPAMITMSPASPV